MNILLLENFRQSHPGRFIIVLNHRHVSLETYKELNNPFLTYFKNMPFVILSKPKITLLRFNFTNFVLALYAFFEVL